MTNNPFTRLQKTYFTHKAIATILSLCMICSSSTCQNPGVTQEAVDKLSQELHELRLKEALNDIKIDLKDIKNTLDSGGVVSQEEFKQVKDKIDKLTSDFTALGDKVPTDLKNKLDSLEQELVNIQSTANDAKGEAATATQAANDAKDEAQQAEQKAQQAEQKAEQAKKAAQQAAVANLSLYNMIQGWKKNIEELEKKLRERSLP